MYFSLFRISVFIKIYQLWTQSSMSSITCFEYRCYYNDIKSCCKQVQ